MVERLVRHTVTSISAAAAVSALWMISSSMGEMSVLVMPQALSASRWPLAWRRQVQPSAISTVV